jgi:hypothetical protein
MPRACAASTITEVVVEVCRRLALFKSFVSPASKSTGAISVAACSDAGNNSSRPASASLVAARD